MTPHPYDPLSRKIRRTEDQIMRCEAKIAKWSIRRDALKEKRAELVAKREKGKPCTC